MRNYRKKICSLLVILFLVFPLEAFSYALADPSSGKQVLKNSMSVSNHKLSHDLLEEFTKQDKVSIIIKLKEKVDTEQLVKDVQEAAQQNRLSAYKTKFLQKSAVVSELKSLADFEQAALLTYLEEEKVRGKVENIKSYFIVNAISVTTTEEIAKKIASFPEVEEIKLNKKRKFIPSNFLGEDIDTQRNQDNIEWNVSRVGADKAWEEGIDGDGVVIAVIDSGAQWDHPALKEKYRGYNKETGEVDHNFSWFDVTQSSTEPYDDLGHGTHVTGTILGGEPDGSNQVGVAKGAKWLAVKAFTDDGEAYDTEIIEAGEWILAPRDSEGNIRIDMAPDIVNNSWSGGPGLQEWFRDVVIAWRAAGIFPVFAAGNTDFNNTGGPGSIAIPANYPESFAVGATDKDNSLASFSLQGPSPYGEVKPDISAPGVSIRSAIPDNYYATSQGTSMAAPLVSGVAALLLQADSSLTLEELEDLLKTSAFPLTDENFDQSPNNGYGHGLVSAEEALSIVKHGEGVLEGRINNKETGEIVLGSISILESGRLARMNLETEQYSLRHKVGEYTAKAEAYGYESEEQVVVIEKDQTTTTNFLLKEFPKGFVEGRVINEKTGNPVKGVKLYLIEDANIHPVLTDEEGFFRLEAYHGSYTLRVVSWNYLTQDFSITIDAESSYQEIELEPYYTYPGGEIGYDDGTAENSVAFYGSSLNGYGVRMTLPEEKQKAILTEGLFMFDEFHVDPEATEFLVEVWDAKGENGRPGEKIAGPFEGKAIREKDTWTAVDLKEHHIEVESEFYLVYIQKASYKVPGLSIDQNGRNAGRSYEYIHGAGWRPVTILGNYMIRSKVAFELYEPSITHPKEDLITNQETILIEGESPPTTKVEVRNHDISLGKVDVKENGVFSFEAQLQEGENEIIVASMIEGEVTGLSHPVKITLDQQAPELTIIEPQDGTLVNREVITIKGKASDRVGLDRVVINGEEASLEEGMFAVDVILEEGKNQIHVVAWDLAGNTREENLSVELSSKPPLMNNIEPSEDQHLLPGDLLEVSFTSESVNGHAFFRILLPQEKNLASSSSNVMEEIEPGLYIGNWLVPHNINLKDAIIEISFTDQLGNTRVEQTSGKLSIYQREKLDRLSGSNRYETAVALSQEGWLNSDLAILSRGDDFADSLVGVPLSYHFDAPILLTKTKELPEVTKEELIRLGVKKLIVLGGNLAISQSVIDQIKDLNIEVERISGNTRYETATKISRKLSNTNSDRVIIANGEDFSDSLSAAAHAATNQIPILLTKPTQLPKETKEELKRLKPKEVIVLGGVEAVSDQVFTQLPNALRVSGKNRYETNIKIQEFFELRPKHYYVAVGNDFADALTGAALAAKRKSSILLVQNNRVPSVLSKYIADHRVKQLTLLGGSLAIDESVYEELMELVK